jgi:Asp-tRNA(Asn)/Glu-tRNA(Gln) amidotransferase A subunit family amidase
MLSEINCMTAAETAREIAARRLSCVEVVEASLRRIEETEPQLNAFVQVDAEGALVAARKADADVNAGEALGPLHGVPVSVKDLIDVEGLKATYGSLTLKDAVAPADAPCVERLRAAGAVIIGKTTTSEFGYRGYTRSLVHGNTRNPWHLGRTPGGSSGGRRGFVAAGVSAIASAPMAAARSGRPARDRPRRHQGQLLPHSCVASERDADAGPRRPDRPHRRGRCTAARGVRERMPATPSR